MIAADTNIALRLILNDDEEQVAAISRAMASRSLFLPLTVLLETGGVLASRYAMNREQIAIVMSALLSLDSIEIARPELVRWAIERFRAGADWADMIHLVAAQKLGAFVTMDRRLLRKAGEDSPVAIEMLA